MIPFQLSDTRLCEL